MRKPIMDKSPAILIVEDDREIGRLVSDLLVREGFAVRVARTGSEMDALLRNAPADLIVLDLMLPGEDGLSICRRLRAQGSTPVLMLTAKGDDIDRIVGLELGADDYMPKPFNPRELLARIRAILRRSAAQPAVTPQGQRLRFADFVLDVDGRRLFKGSAEIVLSSGEFDLLCVLARHPLKVLSRDQLMEMTRGRSWEAFDRAIDVALSRLRRKIGEGEEGFLLIRTVRNAGYSLCVPVVAA